MSTIVTPRRTDAQMIGDIRSHLKKGAATRYAIGVAVKISRDILMRLLVIMEVDGDIEAFDARMGNNTCRIYCIKGTRESAAHPAISGWATTLAGFRNAVTDAHTHGRDPFEVQHD